MTPTRRELLVSAAALAAIPGVALAADSGLRVTRFVDADSAELADGGKRATVRRGERFGVWTLVELIPGAAVLEDFTRIDGRLLVVGTAGVLHDFGKTAESTAIDYAKGFLGHSVDEVMASPTDLLGAAILAKPGDPNYDEIATVFPPIRKVWLEAYNFLGTPETTDKVWFAYGGRSPNFDPAVYHRSIEQVRKQGQVRDGLVGGHLPFLRFVFPEANGDWTEMVAFAPFRIVQGNINFQPVWYRTARIESGKLAWLRHDDSFLPVPPATASAPAGFYTELLATAAEWNKRLAEGLDLDIPDRRMADQARHGLIRAMMTRWAGSPKYGIVDRNYGGTEHDGFPDTFTVETEAMLDWGLIGRAGEYIDTQFGKYVRDDGNLIYRGPEFGQFGRMLTVVGRYWALGGDPEILKRHARRIDAVADKLLGLRATALQLPKDSPAHGMIAGWSEADSVLEADPQRYWQPYFANSTEAARGFAELGRAWTAIGMTERGRQLLDASRALGADLQTAIGRSILTVDGERILPSIAGVKEPFHVAVAKDHSDPQYRGYRTYMEMLHSGILTREQAAMVVDYRQRHHDVILGVPMAYGLATGEMAGFLAYGHGFGLIQIDRIREALLLTHAHAAHQYTRGMWMAPETRKPMLDVDTATYCSPAECVQPMLLRWLLAFEEPDAELLWLGKGVPRDWLAPGKSMRVGNIPTRWGRAGYAIDAAKGAIEARVDLPKGIAAEVRLRLRGAAIRSATVDGKPATLVDSETIRLPAGGGAMRAIVTR